MNAVDSEHKKNIQDDAWRLHRVRLCTSNPKHPLASFSTGSLETLNKAGIRDALLAFHARYYSANLMRLVIYGPQPLEQLGTWADEIFSAIPNRAVGLPPSPGVPLWTAREIGQIVYTQTIKDMNQLYIQFSMPDMRALYRTKPADYLTHLLGYEGEGSILSLLKSRGWATGLGAYCDTDDTFPVLNVAVRLSEEGLRMHRAVISTVFAFISLLTVSRAHWDECRQLADINFRWKEQRNSSTMAHKLAGDMHRYDSRHIVCGAHLYEEFDRAALQAALDALNVANFRVTLACNRWSEEDLRRLPWQTEKFYGAVYAVQDLPADFVASLRSPEVPSGLHMPRLNPFIPTNFEVLQQPATNAARAPRMLAPNLAYKMDDTFGFPKGIVKILFRSPLPLQSPAKTVMTSLVEEYLTNVLTERVYDAVIAGMSFCVSATSYGLELQVSGFNDKLLPFLGTLLREIMSIRVDASRFAVVKSEAQRELANWEHDAPYRQAPIHVRDCLQSATYTVREQLDAIGPVCGEAVERHAGELLGRCAPTILVHGNFKEDAAWAVQELVRTIVNPAEPHPAELVPIRPVRLPPGGSVVYELPEPVPDVNSCLDYILQVGMDDRARTLAGLFVQIFNEPFFDTLRTQEQLGYIVAHRLREDRANCVALRFLVQSERTPQHLEERVEAFLATQVATAVASMTQAQLGRHIQARIDNLLQKKKRLSEEAAVYWDQLRNDGCDFERSFREAERLPSVTVAELDAFVARYVLSREQRRKLSVHLWSAAHVGQRGADPAGALVVRDRHAFLATCGLYPAVDPLFSAGKRGQRLR